MTVFPLEIYDLILYFAFRLHRPSHPCPARNDGPSPDSKPPAHLLRVCSDFRALTTSYLFHHISILESSDWTILFDEDDGILSASTVDGRRRAALVRDFQLDLGVDSPSQFFELSFNVGVTWSDLGGLVGLEHLCLVSRPSDARDVAGCRTYAGDLRSFHDLRRYACGGITPPDLDVEEDEVALEDLALNREGQTLEQIRPLIERTPVISLCWDDPANRFLLEQGLSKRVWSDDEENPLSQQLEPTEVPSELGTTLTSDLPSPAFHLYAHGCARNLLLPSAAVPLRTTFEAWPLERVFVHGTEDPDLEKEVRGTGGHHWTWVGDEC